MCQKVHYARMWGRSTERPLWVCHKCVIARDGNGCPEEGSDIHEVENAECLYFKIICIIFAIYL